MEHLDVAVIGGGPSGLAAAYALRKQELKPVVLEASGRTADSWPHYIRQPHPVLPGPVQLPARPALRWRSGGTRTATR
ncbi:FAD-dependent oxidoreductase [Streptomyces sp. NBC_00154]|uniref:FAD-dependent oxidoreductase n=1 Tax=Streptomyces sp. NBC_00154 TaxID=2975670 RepID=UPI00225B5473|nr:FAD-dependent oxidoreductase [Streptomyces sp. NBC_00154]MCX5309785.1 NAD(P)-binding protein [Streptomyces sp. NBC_00154]